MPISTLSATTTTHNPESWDQWHGQIWGCQASAMYRASAAMVSGVLADGRFGGRISAAGGADPSSSSS
jgi:hypothetical protein